MSCWLSRWQFLALLVSLAVLDSCAAVQLQHTYDPELLLREFKSTFPLRDGSTLISEQSTLVQAALHQFQVLGIPLNQSEVGGMQQDTLLHVFMLAVLGNLALDDSGRQFVADSITGKIVLESTYESNRVLVFEVLVFAVLVALARVWLVDTQCRQQTASRQGAKNASQQR